MFGRKDDEDQTQEAVAAAPPATRTEQPHAAAAPRATSPSGLSRRMVEMPGTRMKAPGSDDSRNRTLTVGNGLSLAGEIASCDILIVEGKVEAKLTDGKLLQIAESGQFRGNVEIENADIAGRYDGQLVVHGRLTVRSTGRVSGMIKYGELEVSAGGQIIGELQVTGGQQLAAPTGPTSFKSAAKFAAFTDEDDEHKDARKSA